MVVLVAVAVELLALVVVAAVVVVVLVFATSASITLLFSLLESHCGNILPTFFELIDVAYQHVSFPHNFRFRMICWTHIERQMLAAHMSLDKCQQAGGAVLLGLFYFILLRI